MHGFLWPGCALVLTGALLLAAACSPSREQEPPATAPAALPNAEARPERLLAGDHRERFPVAKATHAYELALRPGDLVDLRVEQRGADVALRLFDPEGKAVLRIDSPNGRRGPERLLFAADRGGVYRVDVEAGGVDPNGAYDLVVAALRPAQAAERVEAETWGLFAQAEELRRQGSAEALAQAVELYPRVIERWRRAGESQAQARAVLQWAAVLTALGDSARTSEALEAGIALLQRLRDPRREALAWADLGQARHDRGDAGGALAADNRARTLARELGDERLEARALNQIGLLFREAGQLVTAEWAYEHAASLYQRRGLEAQAGLVLANLASLYVEAREVDLAERAVLRSAAALQDSTLLDRAYLASQRGTVARLAAKYDEARALLETAAELYRQAGRLDHRASALQGLAHVSVRQGRLEEAETLLREVLAFAESRTDPRATDLARQDLGQILLRRGDLGGARQLFEQALAEARGPEQRALRAAALLGLARIERQAGHLELAWAFISDALELVEGRRGDAVRRELRLALVADAQDFFDLAVEAAVALAESRRRPEDFAQALAASERGRARGLLDALTEPARPGADEGPRLGRRAFLEDQRREQERRREALIEAGAPAEELRAVELGLEATLALLGSLPAPDLAHLGPAPEREPAAGRLEDRTAVALGRLPEDAVLLEYDLGESRSFLFVAARGRVEAFALPPRVELETLAQKAHEVLSGSTAFEAGERPEQALRRLGRALLGPVAGRLRGQRLLVVPDGALWVVPFGALVVPATEGEPRFLADDHEVAYAPSLAAWATLLDRRRGPLPALPRALVFADPVFQSTDSRSRADAGEPAPDAAPELGQSLRSVGGTLRRLKHSAGEAETLRELLPPSHLAIELDFEASKARLRSLPLGSFDLLHFATHGILHPKEPSLSGLVLSLVDESGRPRDGFLRAHEIETLGLTSSLVVLSACRTAQGKLVGGEGVISLSNAFFRAGAARVLVTLWPVDDEATSFLMRQFYRALLLERRSPAAALRAAQAAVRAVPRWSQAFYWAGFVLQGDF